MNIWTQRPRKPQPIDVLVGLLDNLDMSDLTKILLSVGIGWLGGLISGILLEPFKAWYMRRFTAKRARKEIYRELGKLYEVFCLANNRGVEDYCHNALKYNPTETFDFYFQQHREACFLIPGWRGLEGFYEVYKVARQTALERGYDPQASPIQNIMLAKAVAAEFEYRFERKQLNESEIVGSAKYNLAATTE